MALVKLKPTSPGRRGTVRVVNPDSEVAVISVNIVLLIFVVKKMVFKRL